MSSGTVDVDLPDQGGVAKRQPGPRLVYLALLASVALVALLRVPTLFEPAWHTDEGTFAGVAQGLLHGRGLYSQAWESKPPLFLLSYAGLFKLLGVGVWQPKLGAAIAALATQLLVFLIGRRLIGDWCALAASFATGLMLAVPFWEGNLALSEIYSLPFEAAGVLLVVVHASRPEGASPRRLAAAGALFAAAFLMRQPAALALPCAIVWLWLTRRSVLREAVYLGLGFGLPLLLTLLAFALAGSFGWFWNANVSYFLFYIPTGNRLTDQLLPLLFLPLVAVLAALFLERRAGRVPVWALPALWYAAAFIGSLLNGKDYSHYLLLTFPPLTLLAAALWPASIRLLPARPRIGSAFALVLVVPLAWLLVVGNVYGDRLGRHWTKGLNYYANFYDYVSGHKTRARYAVFFDHRWRTTSALDSDFSVLRAAGRTTYIWGEYPWVYALADLEPISRYVTSYYILEDDQRGAELLNQLRAHPPAYLVIAADAEPRGDRSPTKERYARVFRSLQDLVAADYQVALQAGSATIFSLRSPPAAATESSR